MNEKGCAAVPIEDQCAATLAHYDEISAKALHWNNQVPQAIKFWFLDKPKLKAELAELREQLASARNEVAPENISDTLCREDDGCPTEGAVLRREWRALREQLAKAERREEFYKRRCDELQRWQSAMRDPERTLVCDVLANGTTLPPSHANGRYGTMTPSDTARRGQTVAPSRTDKVPEETMEAPVGLFWQTGGDRKWHFVYGVFCKDDIHDNGMPIRLAYMGGEAPQSNQK